MNLLEVYNKYKTKIDENLTHTAATNGNDMEAEADLSVANSHEIFRQKQMLIDAILDDSHTSCYEGDYTLGLYGFTMIEEDEQEWWLTDIKVNTAEVYGNEKTGFHIRTAPRVDWDLIVVFADEEMSNSKEIEWMNLGIETRRAVYKYILDETINENLTQVAATNKDLEDDAENIMLPSNYLQIGLINYIDSHVEECGSLFNGEKQKSILFREYFTNTDKGIELENTPKRGFKSWISIVGCNVSTKDDLWVFWERYNPKAWGCWSKERVSFENLSKKVQRIVVNKTREVFGDKPLKNMKQLYLETAMNENLTATAATAQTNDIGSGDSKTLNFVHWEREDGSKGTDYFEDGKVTDKFYDNSNHENWGKPNLVSAVIGPGITEIGRRAFTGCCLNNLVLPNALKKIGDYAFSSTCGYEEINFPSSLEYIGSGAFGYTTLRKVFIPKTVKYVGGAAFYSNSLPRIEIESRSTRLVSSIGGSKTRVYFQDFTLQDYKDAEEYSKENGVYYTKEKDGQMRFDFDKPKQYYTENDDKPILFEDPKVEEIIYDDYNGGFNKEWLEEDGVENLTVGILKRIGNGEYFTEDDDVDVDYRDFPLQETTDSMWRDTEIEKFRELKYFVGVEEIPDYCFAQCRFLEVIGIPQRCRSIQDSAFLNCRNLKEIEWAGNGCLQFIGECAFANTAIETLVVPEGVKEIDNYAFSDCDNLKSVVLPKSLVRIGKCAFSGCRNLKSVQGLSSSIEEVGEDIFYETPFGKDCDERFRTTQYETQTLLEFDWIDDTDKLQDWFLEGWCLTHYDTEDWRNIDDDAESDEGVRWADCPNNPNSDEYDEDSWYYTAIEWANDDAQREWHDFLDSCDDNDDGWWADDEYFNSLRAAVEYAVGEDTEFSDIRIEAEDGGLTVCGSELYPVSDRTQNDDEELIDQDFIDVQSRRYTDRIQPNKIFN